MTTSISICLELSWIAITSSVPSRRVFLRYAAYSSGVTPRNAFICSKKSGSSSLPASSPLLESLGSGFFAAFFFPLCKISICVSFIFLIAFSSSYFRISLASPVLPNGKSNFTSVILIDVFPFFPLSAFLSDFFGFSSSS